MSVLEDWAWCAGLFDGEGSTSNFRSAWDKKGEAHIYTRMHVGQKDRRVLDRFLTVTGVGHINETKMNGQPFFNYSANSLEAVTLLGNMLWPHLSEIKREQYTLARNKATSRSGIKRKKAETL